jgi:mono/diheme cytochrome c family protein
MSSERHKEVFMRVVRRLLLLILLMFLIVAGVVLYYVANPNLPVFQKPEKVHYLPQWSGQDRQTYYYTAQGTQVKGLRYDWFVALEQPFSQSRFAEPDYLARFGFLTDPTQKATTLNPGNLPVGFAQHTDPNSGTQFLDITCAACHTGELRFNGQAIRIDGGAALHSLASTVPTLRGGSFGQALGMSMAFTYYNPVKFQRFATAVLGPQMNDDERKRLRKDFKSVLDRLLGQAWNDTHRGLYPTQEGFGRTDAFGRIANSVFGEAIDPGNYRVADAPVSYPQLWDIWKFDWVQWNGSAMQPMARNIGESLGVGATLHLFDGETPLPEGERYPSTVLVNNLYTLEETLKQLKPPTWPQDVLGKIDLQRASRGRALFTENCAHCHAPKVVPPERRMAPGRDPEWHMQVVPISVVGTDPTTADNIADHRFDVRKLGWTKAELGKLDVKLFGSTLKDIDLGAISSAKGLAYVTAYVENQAYRDAGIAPEQRPRMDGYGLAIGVQEIRGYKPRPLDGIWATPPFLHNGSVPSLFELLSPVSERQASFWVGNFEYDPLRAGFQSGKFEGGFFFDTAIKGNGNQGHEFRDGCRTTGVIGRALAPDERLALIEYLKVLGNAELENQLQPVEPRPWSPGPRCQG